MTIVLICGSRDWPDPDAVLRVVASLPHGTLVVHGGARGADAMADAAALACGLNTIKYPADWQAHGRAAGPIRNQRMLDEEKIDRVIAFDMGTPGTADMIRRARAAGVDVTVYRLDPVRRSA